MQNMPLLVNHNVLVVAVFDLQSIADQRIRRQTLCKVLNCPFMQFWIPLAKFYPKELR